MKITRTKRWRVEWCWIVQCNVWFKRSWHKSYAMAFQEANRLDGSGYTRKRDLRITEEVKTIKRRVLDWKTHH